MTLFLDTLSVVLVYCGFGFFLSRFLRSRVRNIPLTWLVLSLLFSPVWLSLQHIFFTITPLFVAVSGAGYFILGLAADRWLIDRMLPRATLIEETHKIRVWETCLYVLLFTVFLFFLVSAKLTLIRSLGPTILDDANNTNKLMAVGFNLDQPRYFHMPLLPLNYYYFDFYLSGALYRLTSFTAQQSLFVHNILEYVAFMYLFAYAAVVLFSRVAARLTFILSSTFAGGFEYFIFKYFDRPIPAGHVEWWVREVPIPHNFDSQISAMYTLFLWVPQHLIAGMCFLVILLLAAHQPTMARRAVIAILFSAILGFSTFVFLTAILSYMLAELLLLHAVSWPKRMWKLLPVHVLLFLGTSAFMLHLYLLRSGKVLFFNPKIIEFLRVPIDAVPEFTTDLLLFVQDAVNFVLTTAFILSIDMGAVFFLAIAAFTLQRSAPKTMAWRLACFTCVTAAFTAFFLSFVSSINFNDVYMRGFIVGEIALFLGAALFMERQRYGRLPVILLLIALLPLHLTNFTSEWNNHRQHPVLQPEAMYLFMRDTLPKDAVIFTDTDLCGLITYRGNRLCVNNMNEVDQQYTQIVEDDVRDYHTAEAAIATAEFPHRYFLSWQEHILPEFEQVYGDGNVFIYQVIARP